MTTSFGAFRLDSNTKQLLRDGREVHLSRKAFELLVTLLEARPRVLSKADLQQHLWPETFVTEANLSNLVAEVRAAIGDRARAPRFVRTAHGFGYAFCGEATMAGPQQDAPLHPACWLDWDGRRFPLCAGDHIIGRDGGADIRLDAPTVSRRHARLIIGPDGVSVEDLGSKNGTFRADARVTTFTELADGDVVRLGCVSFIIRVQRPFATTDTAV